MRIQSSVPSLARLIGSRVGEACGRLGVGLAVGSACDARVGEGAAADAVATPTGVDGATDGAQAPMASGRARTTLAMRRCGRILYIRPMVGAFRPSG